MTGHTVARFLHGRFSTEFSMPWLWCAVAAVADQEIDAILMEPQPSLADCFMMFDRTCLGGRA